MHLAIRSTRLQLSVGMVPAMKIRVKICGLTRVQDAMAAVEAGADALGFNFFKRSPRCITAATAKAIIAELPPFIAKVGVFVNASEATIQRLVDSCGLDAIQLHGDEPPKFCARFRLPVIKAFRIASIENLRELPKFDTHAWLLDSSVPGQRGGTGTTADWELVRQAVGLGRPVILAGGLTPANVAKAMRQVRPFAVDVSSGVESAPGIKDHAKIRAFIQRAKSVG